MIAFEAYTYPTFYGLKTILKTGRGGVGRQASRSCHTKPIVPSNIGALHPTRLEPSDHSSKLELGIFSKSPIHWLSSCICGAFLHSHASSQRWKFSRKLTPTLVSMSCVSQLGLAVGLWEWVIRFNYRRTLRCVIAKNHAPRPSMWPQSTVYLSRVGQSRSFLQAFSRSRGHGHHAGFGLQHHGLRLHVFA